MIDFSLQLFPPYGILQRAHCQWLHKNCWWLIIMARGEHFTPSLPPYHSHRSFPLSASRWSARSMRHACIPKMASTGARVEGALWTSRQGPLPAAALSLHGVITAAALQQVKVEHRALLRVLHRKIYSPGRWTVNTDGKHARGPLVQQVWTIGWAILQNCGAKNAILAKVPRVSVVIAALLYQ